MFSHLQGCLGNFSYVCKNYNQFGFREMFNVETRCI